VLDFVQPEHAEMHADAVFGKHARDLAADEHVGPVGQHQRAANLVMVGDGDEVHAPRLGAAVHALGRVVRLAEQAAEMTDRRTAGIRRVDVRVDFHGSSCRVSRSPRTNGRRLGTDDRSQGGLSRAAVSQAGVKPRCRTGVAYVNPRNADITFWPTPQI
jgi:hypothetical protein